MADRDSSASTDINVTTRAKPPRLLAIIAIGYVLYSVTNAVLHFPEAAPVVRTILGIVLAFFVLRGSRTAGGLWFIANLLGALMSIVGAFQFLRAGRWEGALIMGVLGALLLWHCHYLMFNPAVRRFQQRD